LIKPNLNRSIYEDYQVQNQYVHMLYDILKDCRGNNFDRSQLMSVVNKCKKTMEGFRGWYEIAQEHIGKQIAIAERAHALKSMLYAANQENANLIATNKNLEDLADDLSKKLEKERDRTFEMNFEFVKTQQYVSELDIIKNSLSFKIGNIIVLAFKKPGWRTLRLPYDLLKCIINALTSDSSQKNNMEKSANSSFKSVSKPARTDAIIQSYSLNLEAKIDLKMKLAKEHYLIENRIKELKAQINVFDPKQSKGSLTQYLSEAIYQSNTILMKLKDIDDDILELKISKRALTLD
jgi:hypothetical protein